MLKNAFNTKSCDARCTLTNCEGISSAKSIDLSGCDLHDLPQKINELKFLEALDLSNNDIKTIIDLDKLPSLQYLNLGHNKISDIRELELNRSLKTLRLHDNNINKVDGLNTLINLKRLDLRNNNIERIEGFENLINLKRIELEGNPLKSLDDRSMLRLGVEFDVEGIRLRREQIAKDVIHISQSRKHPLGRL